MEASSGIPPKSSSASSEAGGEVRRIHIIYFLSHNLGRFEHPHLIRVHHFNRNGVYLRDVKRWLADLRGKDMPKAFAWSYKRRYKNGYVWQDLLDDDLITPISDNEFVLKGSGIFVPPANPFVGSAYGEKKAADLLMKIENDNRQVENTEADNKAQDHDQFPSPNQICDDTLQRKTTSSEISHESPIFSSETSTVTEDSTKEEENARKPSNPPDEEQIDIKVERSSSYTNFLGSKSKKNQKKRTDTSSNIEKMGKSYSSGTSKMLRNLMTCGAADTNDAAMVRRSQKCNDKYKPIDKPADQICKGEDGGSAKVLATPWNQQKKQHDIANARESFGEVRGSRKQPGGFGGPKVFPPAYKPVAAPICSQCEKSFRPEKLHSHMRSCRGLKALTKAASAYIEKTSSSSHISADSESEDGYS